MPPRHHAVLDDHLTKLYATAESQLQSYVAALAEGKRKAALLSDGKKMENGHPCVNFVFANNDGTMFCKNVDTFGHSKTAEWYAAEIKKIIEESGGSVPLVLLDSAGECVKCRNDLAECPEHDTHCRRMHASYLHTPGYSAPPPSGGNGPGLITLGQCSHPRGRGHCSASAPAGTETVVRAAALGTPEYPRIRN